MRLISHRGNLLSGQTYPKENTIQAIEEAICLGYDVEIDVWREKDGWFLGHDLPLNRVSLLFLIKRCRRLWFHCKNKAAHDVLKWFGGFMHEDEPYAKVKTLFSEYKWNHSSNHDFHGNSVCVMPELCNLTTENYREASAVCSDDIVTIDYELKKLKAARF
jgi:glycerophosphoryl diester phosphodiesterase